MKNDSSKNGTAWEAVCWRSVFCRISSKAVAKQVVWAEGQETNMSEQMIAATW